VGDESDGHAEAWFLPAGCKNLADGYATVRLTHVMRPACQLLLLAPGASQRRASPLSCPVVCTPQEGSWYGVFKAKFEKNNPGFKWSPGSATALYPNEQPASHLWYHDHT
jgi:hypothetical protein